MKHCIYCNQEKTAESFSDEHIWPNALGGDFLPRDIWRTDAVCQTCNSLSGVFVDADFIRSWMVKAEASWCALEYLAGKGKPSPIPLNFIGQVAKLPVPVGHVAEYWAGPCGANILHIRPDSGEAQWATYAGGDPRAKKSRAGRAYMSLTSENEFWILVSLASFQRHFDRAERFVVNMEIPAQWPFKNPDRNNAVQADDMRTVDAFDEAAKSGRGVNARYVGRLDLGTRMLAKLGLAVGYNLFGDRFLEIDYAKVLRRGFREANAERRRDLEVHGSAYLHGKGLGGVEDMLTWPGGWVLMLKDVGEKLALTVISPSGKVMVIQVCDEPALLSCLNSSYDDGVVWITVPAAQEAVGPLSLPDYVAHRTGNLLNQKLSDLFSKLGDPTTLPAC
ncbi:HNH endonuclease [Muricoccus vinaceus]|uniref:HNH endonuclease n=1 Tax=Muricoccus vinaceus TaxID=424704 RepID=A0ABV6J1F5_9PROT